MKYTILGIDPGLTNTGYSVLVYDTKKDATNVIAHGMITAISIAKREMRTDVKQYGNIISLMVYEKEIAALLETYKPDFIASEDAFYNPRTPQAYLSLKLCINAIQRVLYNQVKKNLYLIAPTVAKQTVWGRGTANKEAVQESILRLPDLHIKKSKPKAITNLTEHEADSIAIAYTFIKNTLPDLLM